LIESTAKFWEAIYSRNIAKMIGICYRYTANRQLAEDLAHDAFLKAIDKAGSFKGEGDISNYSQRNIFAFVAGKRGLEWIWLTLSKRKVGCMHCSVIKQP
jgi:hypothetical protein